MLIKVYSATTLLPEQPAPSRSTTISLSLTPSFRFSWLLLGERHFTEITLRDYATKWLDRVQSELEEKTYHSYKQNMEHHVLPILGHVKVRKLRVSHVADLLTSKRKARHGAGEGKPYSRNALRLIKAALSSVLTDAVELDSLLKANPALALSQRKKRNRAGQARPEVNPMTWAQRDLFLVKAVEREREELLSHDSQ